MKKVFLYAFGVLVSFVQLVNAQETATLSAQIYGYKNDKVYFDCVQTPFIRQEFYTNPGEEHIYNFKPDGLVCMLVNGKTRLLLQPGDSLHVDIRYEGRNIQTSFSGSENAVKNNTLLSGVEQLKREMRYKSQLLGCVALDIKPKARIDDSRLLLQRVRAMLSDANISAEAATYILSSVESDAYMSFMEYPIMYASVRKTPIDEQEIGDYRCIMDSVVLRSDAVSLSCPEYISMLMRYCFYANGNKAQASGTEYNMPTRFEEMYAQLAAFYSAEQRDAVLYTLLCNFIKNGSEIERADAVYRDYKENYNIDKKYLSILDAILQ